MELILLENKDSEMARYANEKNEKCYYHGGWRGVALVDDQGLFIEQMREGPGSRQVRASMRSRPCLDW